MRTTSASKRSITLAIRKAAVPSPNLLFRQQGATRLGFSPTAILRGSRREGSMGTANFGIAGLDWQQRVNWDRLKKYRTERAREHMKKHGLGAMLCMYDENVRYLTGTLTPGWNRLKPGLRYALLCGDGAPVLFEQADLGFHIEPHSPSLPNKNLPYSSAWLHRAAAPPPQQHLTKF